LASSHRGHIRVASDSLGSNFLKRLFYRISKRKIVPFFPHQISNQLSKNVEVFFLPLIIFS
jgi:hypothetical protein